MKEDNPNENSLVLDWSEIQNLTSINDMVKGLEHAEEKRKSGEK